LTASPRQRSQLRTVCVLARRWSSTKAPALHSAAGVSG
jgi:hypothetical protein